MNFDCWRSSELFFTFLWFFYTEFGFNFLFLIICYFFPGTLGSKWLSQSQFLLIFGQFRPEFWILAEFSASSVIVWFSYSKIGSFFLLFFPQYCNFFFVKFEGEMRLGAPILFHFLVQFRYKFWIMVGYFLILCRLLLIIEFDGNFFSKFLYNIVQFYWIILLYWSPIRCIRKWSWLITSLSFFQFLKPYVSYICHLFCVFIPSQMGFVPIFKNRLKYFFSVFSLTSKIYILPLQNFKNIFRIYEVIKRVKWLICPHVNKMFIYFFYF